MDDLIARIRDRASNPSTRTDSWDPPGPPAYPPASREILEESERRLGFRLPPFLAEVYLRVGNGGFGPGCGLVGLPGGHPGDAGPSIVEIYESNRVPVPDCPTWQWPEEVVPFCEWGCNIATCVDCRSGAVITFEPHEEMVQSFAQTHAGVVDWFRDWVDGVRLGDKMFEPDPGPPAAFKNPFTGKPIEHRRRRLRRQN